MIVNSTPGALTLQANDGECIVFPGEWTLEPKFYLFKKNAHKKDSKKPLDASKAIEYLKQLLFDAGEKGWNIVVED
ncbi:hypothetical protein [Hydrogenophaga sp. 2FB]|uniref:hypothetical protein n=1 Tax=Hydrogenophaga sp. 2FB TaxID=2502187 RepID=UPI0010F957DC|nr:hypothetical protein [Hydrogenophaga sp. 2FB]